MINVPPVVIELKSSEAGDSEEIVYDLTHTDASVCDSEEERLADER